MFWLEINTTNAAFHDSGPTACADELARLLRDIADSVEAGNDAGSARDNNGNRCGGWSITELDSESTGPVDALGAVISPNGGPSAAALLESAAVLAQQAADRWESGDLAATVQGLEGLAGDIRAAFPGLDFDADEDA